MMLSEERLPSLWPGERDGIWLLEWGGWCERGFCEKRGGYCSVLEF